MSIAAAALFSLTRLSRDVALCCPLGSLGRTSLDLRYHFLATDYIIYRQKFEDVNSVVWARLLGSSVSTANQPSDRLQRHYHFHRRGMSLRPVSRYSACRFHARTRLLGRLGM